MLTTTGSLLGLAATLAGLRFAETSAARRALFLIGAVLLLLSSVLARHTFFIALETVVLIGCTLAFVAGRRRLKQAVMAAAGAAVLAWLWRDASALELLGGAGLVAVALGFATNAPIWYALGSLVVGVRAWVEFVQDPAVLPAVFGVLNCVFAAVCLVQMRAVKVPNPVRLLHPRRRRG